MSVLASASTISSLEKLIRLCMIVKGGGKIMIFEQQALWSCPEQTSGASDFRDYSRAKTYRSRVNRRDSKKVNEADCFMKLCACLPDYGKKIDPNGYSVKMLRICLALETDLTSLGSSLKWGGMGTVSNGRCLTAKTLEFPKTERGCSLSDILIPDVLEKYYLSKEKAKRLFPNSPTELHRETESMIQKAQP